MYRLFLALLLATPFIAPAQTGKGVFNQPVMPGPNGVLVFVLDASKQNRRPDNTTYYTISRTDKKGNDFTKLVTLRFPASLGELEKRMDKDLLNEIILQRKLRSAADLYAQLQAGHVDTLGLYMTSLEVLQALGLLYIDKAITQADVHTGYKVEVTQQGVTRPLYTQFLNEIRYTAFPQFKLYHRTATDSMAMVTWYAKGGLANYANIYRNNGSEAGRQMVYHRNDTLFTTYATTTKPGERLSLFIRATDMAGNTGQASDTIHLLALSFANTMAVEHLQAADTMQGILLHWDRLPAKAYFTGIRVLKSRSATDDFIIADTLPASATSWMDRKIIPGTQYYYIVEPIVFDLPQHTAVTPARVTMQAKGKPQLVLAPQGVNIGYTENRNIKISWMPNAELNLFAYYVLRGTSKANMQVVSPAIRDTVYIDSLQNLYAGTSYVYAVTAMDMNMQRSDTSAFVSIVPPKAKVVAPPAGLAARYSEQGVKLYWNNVARTEASVTGYMIYKRKKGERYFTPASKILIPGNYFTDTAISVPGIYEYGCASVDVFGNQSILSSLAEITITGNTWLYPPADFNLRNLTAGIEVSIPASLKGPDSYVIYRRVSTGKATWQKIGEATARNNVYVDRQVNKAQLYVYAVSATQPGMESHKSTEKSIRRK